MKFLSGLLSYTLLLALVSIVQGLKFDIQSYPQGEAEKHERCIRNFVNRDTLVVVTATVSGSKGDGQVLNINVRLTPLYP